jgi:hypothetical protein
MRFLSGTYAPGGAEHHHLVGNDSHYQEPHPGCRKAGTQEEAGTQEKAGTQEEAGTQEKAGTRTLPE